MGIEIEIEIEIGGGMVPIVNGMQPELWDWRRRFRTDAELLHVNPLFYQPQKHLNSSDSQLRDRQKKRRQRDNLEVWAKEVLFVHCSESSLDLLEGHSGYRVCLPVAVKGQCT
eukprot:1529485-Rhodomonas_salina.2